jgi:hypothetical protein
MFVRDEDPIQTLWTNSDRCESLGDLPGAESGVHQKPALVSGNQRTIACTPAPEDRHTQHPPNRAYSRVDANRKESLKKTLAFRSVPPEGPGA